MAAIKVIKTGAEVVAMSARLMAEE